MNIPFKKADILVPKNVDMSKWAVVACDQYTSEPEYWKEVENIVSRESSTLNLIIPEIYLEESNVEKRITKVNDEMKEYLQKGIFETLENSLVYIERTGSNGKVRQGIIGMVDLEEYSYERGVESLIRATEGTVLERIPPRVKVRQNAEIELPHVMILIDDEKKEIIENVQTQVAEKIYDFELMQNGGHIKGYKVSDEGVNSIFKGLEGLAEKEEFNKKYGVNGKEVLLFSVGDGNHSLATAKTCYENLKKQLPKEEYENHPARYALVEIVNLHSEALEFEPIHRVVFEVDAKDMVEELGKFYNISKDGNGQKIEYVYKDESDTIYIQNPKSNLAVGSLQIFIDDYISKKGGKVDYIHGDDVVKTLGKGEGNIGFLLEGMDKSDLFKTVILDGALPRKTFSMGHSNDKRFYLEARKIK